MRYSDYLGRYGEDAIAAKRFKVALKLFAANSTTIRLIAISAFINRKLNIAVPILFFQIFSYSR